MPARALVVAPLLLLLCLGTGVRVAAHAPHDVSNLVALSPDFASDGTVFAYLSLLDHRVLGRSLDGGRTWDHVGFPMARHVMTDIVFSPAFATDRTCFVSTLSGGVYRTQDGGQTWEPVNGGLAGLDVKDLDVSPAFATDTTLYAATPLGLFRSTDAGLSWTELTGGLLEGDPTVVRVAPDDPTLVFAGRTILHRSEDGGDSFVPLSTHPDRMEELDVSPTVSTDGVLLAGLRTAGVVSSSDGGASFVDVSAGLGDLRILALAIAEDGTSFVCTAGTGVYRAATPGGAWVLEMDGVEAPDSATQAHYRSVAPSPGYGQDGVVFLAAFEGMFRSDDGGTTWSSQDVFHQRVDIHAVVSPGFAEDGELYVGNYGAGVMLHHDGPPGPRVQADVRATGVIVGGATSVSSSPAPTTASTSVPSQNGGWEPRAGGLGSLWCDSLAISPEFEDDDTLFYSYVGAWRSRDRGRSWTKLELPPEVLIVRDVAVSPGYGADQVVFAGTNGVGIYRSSDAGHSFVRADVGLPAGIRARRLLFSPDFVGTGTLFLASWDFGVWRSDDGGANWFSASAGLTHQNIRGFAISPTFPSDGTLFAGTAGDGLFRSTDGGVSWQAVNTGLPAGDSLVVDAVALSPDWDVDGTAFCTTFDGGVYRSTDGGGTWVVTNGSGWYAGARDVVLSPAFATDRTVFVTTHDGVRRSRDAGATWTRLPAFVRVDDSHPTVQHDPGWFGLAIPDSHGAGMRCTPSGGLGSAFAFQGRSLTWYSVTGPSMGMVEVFLDDVSQGVLDLYDEELRHGVPVFLWSAPEAGWHQVRLQTTGTSNPASSASEIHDDGFAIRP